MLFFSQCDRKLYVGSVYDACMIPECLVVQTSMLSMPFRRRKVSICAEQQEVSMCIKIFRHSTLQLELFINKLLFTEASPQVTFPV